MDVDFLVKKKNRTLFLNWNKLYEMLYFISGRKIVPEEVFSSRGVANSPASQLWA